MNQPKCRKDILNTVQDNFWNYSTVTKILIIIGIVSSVATFGIYIEKYICPTILYIYSGDIFGWEIVWRLGLAYILYEVWRGLNLIFVSLGGAAICMEEKWDNMDFAKAWMNMDKYEKYFNNNSSDENSDFEK
jgi:hypothetical protein